MPKDFITAEVIRTMKSLQRCSDAKTLVKPSPKAVTEGLRSSANAVRQQELPVLTPWMKNWLKANGDLPKDSTHKEGAEKVKLSTSIIMKTHTVSFIQRFVREILERENGPERKTYNEELSVFSKQHYDVDCWLANKFDEYWFDIKPGQARELAETIKKYEVGTELTTPKVIDMIEKGVIVNKAISWMYNKTSDIYCDETLVNVEAPFMNKDSSTSYPYFRNDKTIVAGSDQSYGKYVLEETKRLTKDGADVWAVWPFNVYTLYARFQRGKGRALEAQSRLMNIVVNQVQRPEIEAMKSMPEFIGLCNSDIQKDAMIQMGLFCESNPEYVCGNWDQTKYDLHIGQGLACLSHSIRALRVKGKRAADLTHLRFAQIDKAYIINGASESVTILRGRTPSGDIDTMGQNSYLSWLVDLSSNMSIDRSYSNNVLYKTKYYGFYLGDDTLSVHRKSEKSKQGYSQYCATLGLEVNDSKYAYGLFFLQYRLFREDSGEYVMTYAWPRVLRSMLSKERAKGLGPAGWVLAGMQQLSKLVEYKPALRIVSSIIYALDESGLMLDKPISEIVNLVKQEDALAKEKSKRAKSTTDILYDGNPQNDGKFFKADKTLNSEYLTMLQQKIKDAVDKDFFSQYGYKTPEFK